jgi:hypothetical protein
MMRMASAMRRKGLLACGMAALLLAASAAQATELPAVNLDDYGTDLLAQAALKEKYPAGTELAPVLAALERSVPAMKCRYHAQAVHSCGGISLFRGNFIYRREWTVTLKAPDGKLEAIEVFSTTSAVKDEPDMVVPGM